jgi:hypothetical protein
MNIWENQLPASYFPVPAVQKKALIRLSESVNCCRDALCYNRSEGKGAKRIEGDVLRVAHG